jgi:capsule polysaccharide modification protein KpsS
MVWHPNDPFKNKIHEIPSKKKTQKTSKTKDIIKHHLFQLSYADWPLPTGCAASQCVGLVWEDGCHVEENR